MATDGTGTIKVLLEAHRDKAVIALGDRKMMHNRQAGLYPSVQWVRNKVKVSINRDFIAAGVNKLPHQARVLAEAIPEKEISE